MRTDFIYDCTVSFVQLTSPFTGKERDTESGLDYFPARYLSSNMGRWTSPDPSALYLADPENPQTLNLYAYVGNNPLRYTDPMGLCGGATPTATNLIGNVVNAVGNFFCNLFSGSGNNQSANGAGSPGSTPGAPPDYNLSPAASTLSFSNIQGAGIAASRQAIGPTSHADGNGVKYEWGGLLLKGKGTGTRYTFTNPVTFSSDHQFWANHVMVPFGYRKAGSYHTHPGARIDPIGGDGMSLQDAQAAVATGLPEFMGEEMTGKVWKFDPNSMPPCQQLDHCGVVVFNPAPPNQ